MATSGYTDTRLLINGELSDAKSGEVLDVINPATGQAVGRVAHAARGGGYVRQPSHGGARAFAEMLRAAVAA